MSAVELSDRLELHPSTVRLHLEKLRDAGLVTSAPDRHGTVGRPHLVWSALDPAPSLGLEPDGLRLLTHLLADLAARDPAAADRATEVGRNRGSGCLGDGAPGAGCRHGLEALVGELARLGFDPAVEDGDGADAAKVVSFTRCPFRELAVAYPDLVCRLHQGLVEGILAEAGGATLSGFSTLVDTDPCRAEVSVVA